jgi:Rps23 Pro-64 3,4-dihydroxylase Tpa1-like proline 4-hydroxylase
MELLDYQRLFERQAAIREDYQSKTPFRFVVFDDFFAPEQAEYIYQHYPVIDTEWNGTTYIDQQNKFQVNKFEKGSVMRALFDELNGQKFLDWIREVTQVEDELVGDDELFGAGLHQSKTGAFLNVHIDYNLHPTTKFHRRLNAIVYMNKDWKDEYEGHLELWDVTSGDEKVLLAKVAPTFNRCVIFETNEVSFHGHPKMLNTPPDITRKSIATYYYSKTRPESEAVPYHNTLYVNTEGVGGQVKRFTSGVKALLERINKK